MERTGHYEKIAHRRKLGVVLKYLWSLPSHRSAFRDIANAPEADQSTSSNSHIVDVNALADASASTDPKNSGHASVDMEVNVEEFDKDYFIRFANGIMNETNAQVNEALSNLAEIKNVQTLKSSAEWAIMTSEQRKQHEEKLEEAS